MLAISSLSSKISNPRAVIDHMVAVLPNGREIKIDVARYLKSRVKPRLVVFDKQTPLFQWCSEHNIQNAISGGFTMHHQDKLLGEVWAAGTQCESVNFTAPWHNVRGSVYISTQGQIKIAPRHYLPKSPKGDLLQTGPLLVYRGESQIILDKDPEGISASSDQFDDDWTGASRYPRATIGTNDDFIFCVTVAGYEPGTVQGKDTGLSLRELADFMISLGATEALNLDGGSSSTLVANAKLINEPRAGQTLNFEIFPEGRPIPNAIIFEPASYRKLNLERLYK
jgi:hypothetical protein